MFHRIGLLPQTVHNRAASTATFHDHHSRGNPILWKSWDMLPTGGQADILHNRTMQMINSKGESQETSKSMCLVCRVLPPGGSHVYCPFSCWFPFMCERMIAGGKGLTTVKWCSVCLALEIESNWSSWNLNVQNWEPPSHPRMYLLVLIRSGHLEIPTFDKPASIIYWESLEG